MEERRLTICSYTDDTTLCIKSEAEMNQLLKCIKEASNEYGLTINKSKTKVMVKDRARVLPHTTTLNSYQKVDEVTYLDSLVQASVGSSKEIRRRIILETEAVRRLVPIWKDNYISRNNKLWLLKTLTFSVILYGSDAWTFKVEDVRCISNFEMWAYSRMLRIS